MQSRRLVGCGESGGRNGRKAGRATAISWRMAVTAPEGVSAVWVCGGRVGAGSGLLLGAHYPATSFLRGFSSGEWRSQRLLPLLRLEEGCSKTTFRGIYPARSRTLENPST